MTTISISSIRENISEVVSKVLFAGERVCIERNGKPACALVSIEDLELLEKLEDMIDIEEANKALERNDFVDWDVAKKQLGI